MRFTPLLLVSLIGSLAIGGCNSDGSGGRPVVRVANWGGAGDDGPYEQLVQSF
jgi:hypothetical protein